MKPIYLKMTAFGPYKEDEEIHFDELKDHRLFVISGPTGAGKTTIFDAICFAIYGTSSGSDRENARMLRSDFASDDRHTAVELIFEIHNRKYRVLRQLGHVKEGRKSVTGEKYELYEILADGSEVPVVERQIVTEINRKLEDIVGLTYDQFSQIVMLPQGEFRKLLTSQSENKEAILRKIFKTDRYGKMAKLLEVKKQDAEAEARSVKAMRDSYIEQIAGALPQRESTLFTVLSNHSNIYQVQNALVEEQQFYEDEKGKLFTQYEEAKAIYQAANEKYIAAKTTNDQLIALEDAKVDLQQTEGQTDQFAQLKAKAEAAQRANSLVYLDEQCLSVNESIKAKERLFMQSTEQLKNAEQQLEKSSAFFEEQKLNEPKRKELAQSIHRLQGMQPLYEQIESVQRSLQNAQANAQKYQNECDHANTILQSKKQQLMDLKTTIVSVEAEVVKRPAIIEKLHVAQTAHKVMKQLQTETNKLNEAKRAYEEEDVKFNQIKQSYDELERLWMSNQAYVLAVNLHEGEACPVCGSLEHPNKQSAHSSSVSPEQLEESKQRYLSAEKSRNEKQIAYSVCQTSTQQLQKELEHYQITLNQWEQITQEVEALSELNNRLQQDTVRLTQFKQEEQALSEGLQQLEITLKQLEQMKIQAEKDTVELSAQHSQMLKNMDGAIQHLGALMELINSQSAQLSNLEKAWDQAQHDYQNSQTTVATTRQAVQFTQQQLEDLKLQLQQLKQQFMDKLKQAQFENYTQYREAILPEGQIQQLFDQHLAFSNKLHALREKVREESERLKNYQIVDLTEALIALEGYKRSEEQTYEHFKSAEKYEQQCQQFSEKLSNVADEIHRLEEVSNQITDVYNLLKGNNARKISFERYVQIGYLEQITEAANQRLSVLSNGQFMLICSDRQESHGRQSGLSLDVYDSYTGQTRDVKTLSGGEKFNASLSLALGMADVIQSYQGNVRIDTMFIDEGFGSLDEESLMRAIDTLIDLQKAGRMIGVISHVAELKNMIPAVLHVMKSKEGYSSTKFILS